MCGGVCGNGGCSSPGEENDSDEEGVLYMEGELCRNDGEEDQSDLNADIDNKGEELAERLDENGESNAHEGLCEIDVAMFGSQV